MQVCIQSFRIIHRSFFVLLETMTTSWASSADDHHPESTSSSATDRNKQGGKPDQSSSEGSLFSDFELQSPQQQEEVSTNSTSVQFERGPSFLMPNA